MPRTIIGLDISENIVAAVQVKSLIQGYQITGCYAIPLTEAGGIKVALRGICEQIDPKGSVCNSVVEDRQITFRNLSMPFTEIRKIRQTIGFELETLLASSVENLLIDFIEIDRKESMTNLIGATVNRSYIGEHLADFATLGVEPEVLDIRNVSLANQIMALPASPENGMLICLGSASCGLVLYHDRKIVLLRHIPFNGRGLAGFASQAAKRDKAVLVDPVLYEDGLQALCRSINLTLRSFTLDTGADRRPEMIFITGPGAMVESTAAILQKEMDTPATSLNLLEMVPNIQMSDHLQQLYNPSLMDNALALALRDSKKTKGFNFRREEFQVRTRFVKIRKELTQAAIYLGIIIILLGVGFGLDYRDLKSRNTGLDNRIRELFSQTFPDVTNIVDPMHQMRTRIAELKSASGTGTVPGISKSNSFLDILNDISERIPAELEIQVDRMVVDQDGIQIRGTTDTFNTVDSIKKGLESSEKYRDVIIASANLDKSGKGVRFEIKMSRAL